MASEQHEEDVHDETPGYKLSQPKQSLAEYQQMGNGGFNARRGLISDISSLSVLPSPPASSLSSTCLDCSLPFELLLFLRPSIVCLSTPPSDLYYQRVLKTKDQNTAFSNTNSSPATMNMSGVRDRSVSVSVPAPPPPSPRRDVLAQGPHPPVAAIDLEELLRLLCFKTNTAMPALSTSSSSTSIHTPSSQLVLHLVGSDVLTLEGHTGRDGLGRAEHKKPSSDPGASPGRSPDDHIDAGDESLQRYKLSLGLGGGTDLSDPNDPRVCIIQSLTMESPGRDPVKIDLSVPGTETTLKDHPFTIKEGSRFTMMATFKVQHEVLSGLRYVQIVKRKGVRVSKDSEMIGSYAPNTDKQSLYTKRFQEDEAPSGMLARGHYQAFSSFVDDDKKTHLEFEWSFDITKDW